MRYVPLFLLGAMLVGCPLPSVSSSSGGGGVATADVATGVGTDCGADPTTGTVLCLGVNICPSITIDSSVYPDCGFQIAGAAINIECLCGQYLCPLGAAATCEAAAALLAQENEGTVCGSQSSGGCTYLPATGAATSTATTATTATTITTVAATCDTTCRDQCAGEPSCLQMCGC